MTKEQEEYLYLLQKYAASKQGAVLIADATVLARLGIFCSEVLLLVDENNSCLFLSNQEDCLVIEGIKDFRSVQPHELFLSAYNYAPVGRVYYFSKEMPYQCNGVELLSVQEQKLLKEAPLRRERHRLRELSKHAVFAIENHLLQEDVINEHILAVELDQRGFTHQEIQVYKHDAVEGIIAHLGDSEFRISISRYRQLEEINMNDVAYSVSSFTSVLGEEIENIENIEDVSAYFPYFSRVCQAELRIARQELPYFETFIRRDDTLEWLTKPSNRWPLIDAQSVLVPYYAEPKLAGLLRKGRL